MSMSIFYELRQKENIKAKLFCKKFSKHSKGNVLDEKKTIELLVETGIIANDDSHLILYDMSHHKYSPIRYDNIFLGITIAQTQLQLSPVQLNGDKYYRLKKKIDLFPLMVEY